ncbi:Uncharacterised protein [Cedecea neteri]|uniref:Uncharacterized protein n=1 Tax=Cedecea neteri TaxID=158822 RepID=A0A2X3JAR3_9ENTR|nr:Uncharacterised protein [Cedecea neteri]
MQFVQAGEVVTLQQVVRELGERDPHVVTVQTLFDGFFVNHLVNREVLADITQEGQHVHTAEPVIVVSGNAELSPQSKSRNGAT